MCLSSAEQAGDSGSRETEARGGLRVGKDWINPAAAQSNTDKPRSVKKQCFFLNIFQVRKEGGTDGRQIPNKPESPKLAQEEGRAAMV